MKLTENQIRRIVRRIISEQSVDRSRVENLVQLIRADAVLGRNSMSGFDEAYSDDELGGYVLGELEKNPSISDDEFIRKEQDLERRVQSVWADRSAAAKAMSSW